MKTALEILESFDARDWANSFNEVLVEKGEQPFDPEWLTGWFANALMRGYDEGKKSRVEEIITIDKDGKVHPPGATVKRPPIAEGLY